MICKDSKNHQEQKTVLAEDGHKMITGANFAILWH